MRHRSPPPSKPLQALQRPLCRKPWSNTGSGRYRRRRRRRGQVCFNFAPHTSRAQPSTFHDNVAARTRPLQMTPIFASWQFGLAYMVLCSRVQLYCSSAKLYCDNECIGAARARRPPANQKTPTQPILTKNVFANMICSGSYSFLQKHCAHPADLSMNANTYFANMIHSAHRVWPDNPRPTKDNQRPTKGHKTDMSRKTISIHANITFLQPEDQKLKQALTISQSQS